MTKFIPTPEQLKNGFLITVAIVFAITGAGVLQEDPVLGTIMLLTGVIVYFVKKALQTL